MHKDRSALIVGCGYVGSSLAEKLTESGWDVEGLRRSNIELTKSYKPIYQDLAQPFRLSKRYSHVFYLVSADSYDAESYDRAYRLGVVHLLEALAHLPKPELLVFVSSTSVYAQNDGGLVNEESPVSSEGFARQALLNGEKLVLESGIPAIVLRFSGIYGPGRMRFRDSVLNGHTGLAQTNFYTNRIHRHDCVGVLQHMITNGKSGEIYIGSDSEPVGHNETVSYLAQKAGIEILKASPLSSPSVHRGNKRCSNQKLLASGYQFIYPSFRSGYLK